MANLSLLVPLGAARQLGKQHIDERRPRELEFCQFMWALMSDERSR